MRAAFRLVDGMNLVLRGAVGAMLGVMVGVVFLQILVRFALPPLGIVLSMPWTEELARYLMIWSVFLGSAIAARVGALIAVESLPASLPAPWSDGVAVTALAITVAFFGLLVVVGWRWMEFGRMETSTAIDLPMAWVYAAMPLGSALAIVNLLAFATERYALPALAARRGA